MNDLNLFKHEFDIYLKEYLDKKIEIIKNYTKDTSVIDYINYAKKIILTDGKRIRPYIAYLIYKSLGGKEDKKVLNFLVALEIFHSFCLIHDDIMDNSKLRHGTITSHIYIAGKLKKGKGNGNLSKTGESQAILLGDITFSWSQEIINLNNDFDEKILQKVRKYFYEMAEEVIVGQMIDVDITTRNKVSKELIDEKTRLKTAGYSFIKPLLIGSALSGKDNKNIQNFCKEFGLAMGIAFQTQDDLLDITSSNSKLGKTTSLDKSQNQHTYFTYFPSLEYGKKIISNNFNKAKDLVEKLKIEKQYKKRFLSLIETMKKRES